MKEKIYRVIVVTCCIYVEKSKKIDIIIEDDYRTVDLLSRNNIKTLYFRDVNLKKLNENEFITEVNNWGDIYRIIWNMLEKH